ncbi:MAG: hypothetical protein M4D80_29105 [Myxococcota bacterium]|nr:hypothetical protein [Myxococcota bacterium]
MKRLLPSFAALLLSASPALADEDSDVREGETPQQRDDRVAAQAGHFAVGLRVHFGSAIDKTFNVIGVEPRARYNVTDAISVGARIPLAVSKPDGFATFGGALARAELRLGATIGVWTEIGFMKHFGILLSQQDAFAYSDDADYDVALALGPWIRAKAGPMYLVIEPAFVYQAGSPTVTGAQLPVTALFRAGSVAHIGAMVGLYTGDDFKLGAEDGGRLGAGLVADVKVSTIKVVLGAGFASLLTSDEAGSLYPSVGKSLYVSVGLAYVK